MKKLFLVMILLAAVALAACSGGSDDDATEEPGDNGPGLLEVTPADSGSDSPVDDGDEPGSDGYPGPSDGGYPAPLLPTAIPPGYPAPSPQPTLDAYPGGFAILIRPAGQQCEDPTFADMDAAVAELESAGIKVHEVSRLDMLVCEACGCPTSEHFRVLIDPADLEIAQPLGWVRSYQ